MSHHLSEQIFQRFTDAALDLDALLVHAKKTLPADRYRVLASTGAKLAKNFERVGTQLGMFLGQYEHFSLPPQGPRGPGTVHRLSQHPARRKKR